jgi:hypothetical protein
MDPMPAFPVNGGPREMRRASEQFVSLGRKIPSYLPDSAIIIGIRKIAAMIPITKEILLLKS